MSAVHPVRAPEHLTIDRVVEPESVTLILQGEIDLASVDALEIELRAAEAGLARRIVLDLGGLRFIDSTGLHALINAQRRAASGGHDLLVQRVPAFAQRLFRMTGVASRLTFA